MFPVKNRVLLKWIASYLLLLTIPIALGTVQMSNVKRLMEDEYKAINASAQQKISRQLDNKITEMKKLSCLIKNNNQIGAFIQRSSAVSLNERYTLKDIAEFFQSSASFSDISNCYLYINNEDTVVTAGTVISRELIQEASLKGDIIQSLDFEKYINTYHLYTIDSVEDRQTGSIRLMLVTSLPSASYLKPKATVFQVFSSSFIHDALSNIAIDDSAGILLIDSQGRIISRKTDTGNSLDLDFTQFLAGEGQKELLVNGEKCLVFYSSVAALPGCRCIMIVPMSLIYQKTALIRQNSLLFVIFSVVLGFLLSYLLIYRNYKPVNRIIRQISPYSDSTHKDAFEQIAYTFRTVIGNYNELTQLWEQQRTFLQDKFMESAFQGGVTDSAATRDILSSFGISFPGSLFCVLVMCPAQKAEEKEAAREFPSAFSLQGLEEWKKSLPPDIVLFWLEIDGQLAVLVNFSEGSGYGKFCGKTSAWIDKNRILAASSSIFGSLSSVNSGYQEAARQLYENRREYQQNGVLPQNIFRQKEGGEEFGISRQQEEAFINAICLGNVQSALKIYDGILQEMQFGSLSGSRYNRFAYGIINAVWTAVRRLPEADREFISRLSALSDQFLKDFEPDGEASAAPLVDFACSPFDKNAEPRMKPLISRITDCINENFINPDFNVTCLSDMLGMNLSYLSKYFKSNTGVGLHDYINRVRVNRGKELISRQAIPISRVAELVGFDNLNSFIRAFKKYEFKTPGNYKMEKTTDCPLSINGPEE